MPPLQQFHKRLLTILLQKRTCSYLLKPSVLPTSILSVSVALGIGSIALLDTNFSSAIAQITIRTEQKPHNERIVSQINVLLVNPSIGNDQSGDGSRNAPFQTITQALQLAQSNTVIMLATGTYSANTGEVFPLIIKPGVTIQGNIGNKGKGVNIVGGGDYLSRSFGRQNVAIVGANQASLSGVTVTNSNSRGYGLWIESANTVVEENTFTSNTQDGISITGNATPSIRKNYFQGNGANGITISGDARPEIRENLFQSTGFGINIAQNAAPVVVGNQILDNRSGIVVQATTSPVLRNNLIQGSKEDGLVVIAQAIPDLGNSREPGGNQFRNNRRYDINAKAAKQVVYAAGNNLNKNRISGNVDTSGTTAPIVRNSPPTSVPVEEIATEPEIVFAAANIPKKFNPSGVILSSSGNTRPNSQSPQLPTTNVNGQGSLPRNNSQNTPQLNYVQVEPGVIEFVAPQLMRNQQPDNPKTISNSRIATAPRSYTNTRPGVRYRVLVPVISDSQRELVLSIVPDAFSRVLQGRRVMQVGVFSSQDSANQMVQSLSSMGLRGIIQPFN
jgi:parallel beta-helix repeat protein